MNFYVDFEATQFSNRIISIGCTNELGEKFETLVKPVNGGKINKFITDLTGITPEMVENAPTADEAFNALFDWVIANGQNSIPQYFCYGDGDFSFLTHTIKYMKDVRAISFAVSIKAQLTDYSKIAVQHLNLKAISLKKLYILLKEEEIEQHHNALEDAEMLRFISQNLKSKTIDPEYFEEVYNLPSDKPKKNTKKAPECFIAWESVDRWEADTHADETNYLIKCTDKHKKHSKYFDSYETAALWCLKFAGAKGSPKEKTVVGRVKSNIKKSILNNTNGYNYTWEENNETN